MTIPLNTPLDVKFVTTTKAGTRIKIPGRILVTPSTIEFLKSPFALKDDIKSMQGARWHGYDDPPHKIWTAANCVRNWFSLRLLMGEDAYEWFDRPLKHYTYERPLMVHQRLLADAGLTYHYQLWGAEMGTGKTLSAIEVMERSGIDSWWWIGPKSGLYAVEREFKKWKISDHLTIEIMTYEGLTKRMKNWTDGDKPPQGVIFDESSRLKSPRAQRTQAAQKLADGIREQYGYKGYVILMSGTPSPKSPLDWWAQSEITWPGFLREGNPTAFKLRLGVCQKAENSVTGQTFLQHVTWRDDEHKCDICGELADEGRHKHLLNSPGMEWLQETDPEIHDFVASKDEVSYLYERLKGLVIIQHKKDCLELPDKRYRVVQCTPTASTIRVAKTLLKAAPSTIVGLTWLRELSDGFQYRNKIVGKTVCPVCEGSKQVAYWVDPDDEEKAFTMCDMLDPEYVKTLRKEDRPCATCNATGEVDKLERTVREVPCPKEKALIDLLDENEEQGRLVIFAGFTGSIDRITRICLKEKWSVVRVDGRGWIVYDSGGQRLKDVPLDYWANLDNQRVAFVAHPQSGGLGLTLTESRMAVYYSNDYNPESRSQSEDRIHRIGMDENKGATIVDLIHLPTDENVLNILKDNRRLELMTMGDIQETLK